MSYVIHNGKRTTLKSLSRKKKVKNFLRSQKPYIKSFLSFTLNNLYRAILIVGVYHVWPV